MKVERGGKGGGSSPSPAASSGARRSEAVKATSFAEAMESAAEAAISGDRVELLRQIDEQAQVLLKKRTVTELEKYRSLVTAYMKSVVGDSFKVEEVPSARVIENDKVFIVARKIEAKLLELTDQLLAAHAPAIEIAAATSEIRGLLLDLKT